MDEEVGATPTEVQILSNQLPGKSGLHWIQLMKQIYPPSRERAWTVHHSDTSDPEQKVFHPGK